MIHVDEAVIVDQWMEGHDPRSAVRIAYCRALIYLSIRAARPSTDDECS